jgi:hypothetical protein
MDTPAAVEMTWHPYESERGVVRVKGPDGQVVEILADTFDTFLQELDDNASFPWIEELREKAYSDGHMDGHSEAEDERE